MNLDAKKLRDLLEASGMTEMELSRESKVSIRAMHRILSGESSPTRTTIFKLAMALKVKPEDLMEDEEEESPFEDDTSATIPEPIPGPIPAKPIESPKPLNPEPVNTMMPDAKLPKTKFLKVVGEAGTSRREFLINTNFLIGVYKSDTRHSIRITYAANGFYEKASFTYENYETSEQVEARYAEIMAILQEE